VPAPPHNLDTVRWVLRDQGFLRILNEPHRAARCVDFRDLRADAIGTLREEFDLMEFVGTVPAAVGRWLRDLGI
jgi:hypothetical protein